MPLDSRGWVQQEEQQEDRCVQIEQEMEVYKAMAAAQRKRAVKAEAQAERAWAEASKAAAATCVEATATEAAAEVAAAARSHQQLLEELRARRPARGCNGPPPGATQMAVVRGGEHVPACDRNHARGHISGQRIWSALDSTCCGRGGAVELLSEEKGEFSYEALSQPGTKEMPVGSCGATRSIRLHVVSEKDWDVRTHLSPALLPLVSPLFPLFLRFVCPYLPAVIVSPWLRSWRYPWWTTSTSSSVCRSESLMTMPRGSRIGL